MKIFRLIFLLAFSATVALGQAPITATPISTSRLSFPVQTLNAVPVPFASVNTIGVTGQAQYCYWFVANYPVGSVMTPAPSPFCVQNSANTLTGSNYNAIFPVYPAGATSIDTLRTTSAFSAPGGACNCAVATGTSSGTINDQANSLNSYTVSLLTPASFRLHLTNEVTGSAATHLMLRKEDGTLVQDLSAIGGGGTVTGSGTTNTIPKWTSSSALGNSALVDNGFLQSTTEGVIVSISPATSPNNFSFSGSTAPTACSGGGSRFDNNTEVCHTATFSVTAPNSSTGLISTVFAQMPAPNSTASFASVFGQSSAGNGSPTYLAGLAGYTGPNGASGTIPNTAAVSATAYHGGSGQTSTQLLGVDAQIGVAPGMGSAAVAPFGAALYARSPSFGTAINISHVYGNYVADQTVGGANNPDPWGYFEAGTAKNQFGGVVNGVAGFQQNGTALGINCGTTSACANTAAPLAHFVYGSVPLVSGTPSVATVTGISPAFTSTTSFVCSADEGTTAANGVKIVNTSTTSITVTGPNTVSDVVNWICVGT